MTDKKNRKSGTRDGKKPISLSAKITGILGIIGTISLVLTQLNTIMDFYQKHIGPPPHNDTRPTPSSMPPSPPDPPSIPQVCEFLDVNIFPVFPSYLVNTYNANPNNDHIYWVSIHGKNTCKSRLQITLWLKPETPRVRVNMEEFFLTVDPSKEVDEKRSPQLTIDSMTESFPVSGHYKIFALSESEVKRLIKQNDFAIRVTAANQVYWDLRNPQDKPVDVGFLVASLSAWSILPRRPPQELRDRSARYFNSLNRENDPEQWINNCYTDLFRGVEHVKVHRLSGAWPPRGKGMNSLQSIRTASMVLEGKKADSLEAALLIAALKNAISEDFNLRLVLFALPADPEMHPGEKQILLAWYRGGHEWRAVDLTEPNELDFDTNARQASERLKAVLESNSQQVERFLTGDLGVLYDPDRDLAEQRLLALEFQKARGHFCIAGVPQEQED